MKVTRKLWTWALALVATFALVLGLSTVAYADDEILEPGTNKTLFDNGDGSYTLSLSVTGSASDTQEIEPVKVIVIYDRSNSMAGNDGMTSEYDYVYTANNQWQDGARYGRVGNEYVLLTRTGGYGNRHYWYTAADGSQVEYFGTRYSRSNNTQRLSRHQVAQEAVTTLAGELLANNAETDNPNTDVDDTKIVQLALVPFGTSATTSSFSGSSWTTDEYAFDDAVYGIQITEDDDGGTNWEDAMVHAEALVDPNVKTYIIFVTDGNPTFRNNSSGNPTNDGSGSSMSAAELSEAQEAARGAVEAGGEKGAELYGVYIYGEDTSPLARLVNYANNGGSMTDTSESEYFKTASDKDALYEAFKAIIDKITNALNVSDVEISDQITGLTATTLVENANDFHYYRAGGDYGSFDPENGQYGTEWTTMEADGAKEATFSQGTGVEWNLGDDFKLENGVTYTVTFTVWPSQEAYDLVAKLNNGIITEVPDEYKSQVVYDEATGKYGVKTNPEGGATINYTVTDETKQSAEPTYHDGKAITWDADGKATETYETENATIKIDYTKNSDGTYTITKTSTPKEPAVIENPKNTMVLQNSSMNVRKDWVNTLYDRTFEVTFVVYEDNQPVMVGDQPYTITLNEDNDWEEEFFIATGLVIKDADGNPEVVENGHVYTLKEIDGADYHWDQEVEVVRPMLYENPTVISKYIEGSGSDKDITVEGTTWKTAETDPTKLILTNIVRSGLNLYKVVEAEDGVVAPADAEFTFTVTMNLPEFTQTNETTDDDEVWYTIYDLESGASVGTSQSFATGTPTDITIAPHQFIRFINLPTGTTYTITEKDADGYENTEITFGPSGTEAPTIAEPTISGTIDKGDTAYEVTYTNSYDVEPTTASIPVEKILEGAGAPDITGEYTFTLTAGKGEYTYDLDDTVSKLPEGVELPEGEDSVEVDGVTYTAVRNESSIIYYTRKGTVTIDLGTSPMPEVTSKTNPNADGGTVTFGDIEFVSAGTYTYTVKESGSVASVTNDAAASTGKTITVTVTQEGDELVATVDPESTTFTNTYESTSVTVTKEWDDNDDQDGKRPDDISVQLLADEEAYGDPVTIEEGEDGSWTYTWNNLPKYSDNAGTEVEYTVDELAIDDYDAEIADPVQADDGTWTIAITNTHEIEKTSVTVTKTWDDNNDQDGVRPDDISVQLLADGEASGQPVTIEEGEDGSWSYTWTNLDKYADGVEIEYTVDELEVEGYQVDAADPVQAEDGTWTIAITNTHTPEVTSVTITKVWADSDDIGDIRPESISVQLTADGANQGDPVTLNEDNEWTYTWENLPKYKNGGTEIKYDADETAVPAGYAKTVTGAGTANITVTNTYTPNSTNAHFEVTKVLNGRDLTAGQFSFTMTPGTGAPGSAQTKTNAADGKVTFDDITFTAPGTFTYTIAETNAGANGYTYDDHTVTATVTVTDDGEGNLTAAVSYEGSTEFVNTYEATGTVKLEASKAISGAAWPQGEDGPKTLTFTLSGEGGTLPDTKTATLTAPGKATFEAITYTQADAGKTYTYTITEDGFGSGWTASPESGAITAAVTVTDNGDGTLATSVVYSNNGTVTNTYEATGSVTLEATKAIAGAAWPEDGSVVFTLSGEGGTLPETKTVTLNEPGKATFGAITYDESDAGQTYTYTISETTGLGTGWTASADVTATVTVTDNGDGTLATSVEYSNNGTITNTYKADGTAEITVTKAVAGAAWPQGEDGPKTLTLTLNADEGTPMPETATATLSATGSVTFGPIKYTEADAGKTYTYTVSEDGFGAGWTGSGDITVTVKVTDNGDGKLSTEVSYSPSATITNTYKATGSVDLSAKKVLTGRDWADVDTYTFTLYGNDGSKIEDVTVTAENKDNVAFSTINYTEADAGKTYTYTISETGTLPANVTKSADVIAKVTVTDNGNGTLATSVVYTPEDQTIINTYVPTSVNASITVNKTIDEYIEGSDKTFNFTMTPIDGAPMPEGKTELTASITTENGAGSVTLDPITYTAAGTYQYKVVEKDEATAGWTYDTKEYTVTVTVTDDPATGKLSAEVTYGGEATAVDVHNLFEEESTSVKLHVDKVIDDQSASAEDATFTFVLTPGEGAPGETQTIEITTNGLKGGADFAPIEFTESGTFNYTIQETGTAPSGWTYDTKAYPVVITVSDNFETAILESATTIDGETATSLTITNVYKAGSTKSSLQVTKAIEDTSESAPDVTFEFTLATTDGSPMPDPATATVTGAGTATFGEVEYTKAGEYHYTITETKGGDAGWTNDTTTYPVVVTVTDNEGQLVATAAYGEKSETSLTVTNIYDPEDAKATPKALKTIDDQSNSAPSETFTFQLIDSKGNVVETKTRENGGPVEFTELTFAKVGTYEYTIKEVAGSTKGYTYDTADHSVTIKVEDKGDGNLEATITYADGEQATIKNVYKAEPVEVKLEGEKVLEGGKKLEAGEFTFELTDNDGNKVEGTFTNDADGNIDFGSYTFEKVGTYTYTATEVKGDNEHMTYDSGEHTFVITVTDEGGTLKAEVTSDDGAKVKFTNVYTPEPVSIDPPVEKVITGDKPASPATFTFQLKAITEGAPMPAGSADGIKTMQITGAGSKEFGEIVYTEPGEWVYEISELKGNAEGYTYDTTVYTLTVKVTQNDDGTLTKTETIKGGDAIVFTNKYEAPKTPKTGDTTLQVGPLFLAGAIITGIAAFGARRRED